MKRNALIILLFIFIIALSGCIKEKSVPTNKPPHTTISVPECFGYPPFNVSFSLSAYDEDGYIASWKVDCNGDGIYDYSGEGNPPYSVNYTYTQVGKYTAKFVVVDNNGSTTTSTFVIMVKAPNKPPTCSLYASPSSGYVPLIVTFSLNASDSDGYIESWSLDCNGYGIADYNGNGKPPTTLSHTYHNAGTYIANLTVMDNNSTFAYATVTIVVNEVENKPPHADFTYSINNLTVTFTDSSYDEDGSIVSYHWDFGDGNTSNERNPSHAYNQEGTYSVSLTVKDNDGASNAKTVSITLQQEEEWQPEYGIKYEVHVTNVIDGDTFDAIFPNGSIERVRLLGVDCPEKAASNNKPNEYDGITNLICLAYWGIKAKDFAISWLQGKGVYIEFDNIAGFKGYYGRWLCYVYTQNNTDFNAELVSKGLARVYTEGECSKENYYLTLQQQAIDNRIGLWSCMPKGGGGVVIITVHYDAAGNDWQNLNDEYVVIKNEGNESVDMTGWTISDEANHVYTFPSFVLNAGAAVTIYTGSGVDTKDKLYWGSSSPIWNNDHDTAYLKDNEGKLVDSWGW